MIRTGCPRVTNVGFWVESAENIHFSNTIAKNTGVGWVVNCLSQPDTGTTRPWTCPQSISNSQSLRTHQGIRAAYGGTRSVHLTVTDFFAEANRNIPPYATSTGLSPRGGIHVRFEEVTSGVTFRGDFKHIMKSLWNHVF